MKGKAYIFEEPNLEFGDDVQHPDPRMGLLRGGPHQSPPGERIQIGVVGSARMIELTEDFVKQAQTGFDGKDSDLSNLHLEFPGLRNRNPWKADFELPKEAQSALSKSEIQSITDEADDKKAVEAAVDLVMSKLEGLAQGAHRPNVVVLPLGLNLIERLVNARSRTRAKNDPDDAGGSDAPDFRGKLKARALRLPFAVQIVWEDTLDDSVKVPAKIKEATNREIQDIASRAWTLFNSLYYKGTFKVPFRRLAPEDEYNTCFIGISFYRDVSGQQLWTSSAQMFDERGKGFILRGRRAHTERKGRSPYMAEEDAAALVRRALEAYFSEHKHYPARVMVLKTSRFKESEVNGIRSALSISGVQLKDLVWILQRHPIRVFRPGSYPVLRGTFVEIDDRGLLYTQGSIPYLETYPGVRVPQPLFLCPHKTSDSTIREIAKDVLSLTKVNWNSTAINQSIPAPLRASRKVGEVLKYCDEGEDVPSEFWRYM